MGRCVVDVRAKICQSCWVPRRSPGVARACVKTRFDVTLLSQHPHVEVRCLHFAGVRIHLGSMACDVSPFTLTFPVIKRLRHLALPNSFDMRVSNGIKPGSHIRVCMCDGATEEIGLVRLQ